MSDAQDEKLVAARRELMNLLGPLDSVQRSVYERAIDLMTLEELTEATKEMREALQGLHGNLSEFAASVSLLERLNDELEKK